MIPWAHPRPQPKRHLVRFSRFCRAHHCHRQTDRQTDHATPSLTIGRIYVVLRCGLIIASGHKWSKYFDIRPHCRCIRTVQSYSPGGANMHPHIVRSTIGIRTVAMPSPAESTADMSGYRPYAILVFKNSNVCFSPLLRRVKVRHHHSWRSCRTVSVMAISGISKWRQCAGLDLSNVAFKTVSRA